MKIWKIAVIVVALIVLGAGGYYGFSRVTAASTKKQNSVQTVAAQRGTLVETVSAQGVTSFPNKADLSFGTAGTIQELLVKEGDLVKKGQVLARLDALTINSLKKALAQAKVNLQQAQDNLTDAKTPYSPVVIAQAEAAVAIAKLDVKNAEDALDKALNPYAKEEVAKGIAQVQAAQKELDKALDPYSKEELAKGIAQVQAAQSTLEDSRRALVSTRTLWDTKLTSAKTKASDAEDAYRDVFSKYLGMKLTDVQMRQDPQTTIKGAGIKLEDLYTKDPDYASYLFYSRFQEVLQAIATKASAEVDPLTIYSNLYFVPRLPTTEDMTKELDDAWSALVTARDEYSTAVTQADLAIATAQKNIAVADDSLRLAQKSLDDLKAGADPLAVAVAQDSLRLAKKSLDDLKAGADPLKVAVAKKQLELAKAKLKDAEDDLADKTVGADPLMVSLREVEVASAQGAVDDALQKLDAVTLKATFDGYVTAAPISQGKQVGATATVVSMVDPSVVEVTLTVDETDIARVRLDQVASVNLDALPESRFVGRVSAIVPVGKMQSGVVSYPVTIAIQRGGMTSGMPGGMPNATTRSTTTRGTTRGNSGAPSSATGEAPQLSMGMSALVDIVVQQKENVLLVPSRAVKSNQQGRYVEVVTPQGTEQRTVKVGTSDTSRTEILEGLTEGEMVSVGQAGVQTNLRAGAFGAGVGGMQMGGFGGAPGIGGR